MRNSFRLGAWPRGVLDAKRSLVLVLDLIHMSRRPPSMNMPVRFFTLNFTAPSLEAVRQVAVRPARPSPAARICRQTENTQTDNTASQPLSHLPAAGERPPVLPDGSLTQLI